MSTSNPLLEEEGLPRFSDIYAHHVVPALDEVLASSQQQIDQLEKSADRADWSGFSEPLQAVDERLQRFWSPVSHLNSVQDSPELREAYQVGLERLTAYHALLGQNRVLYDGYQRIEQSEDFASLDSAKQRVISNALRDFRLSGVALEGEARERFRAIATELAALSNTFEQNVLDATDSWALDLVDERDLSGLPQTVIDLARQTADSADVPGWRFTLRAPSYVPFMKYSDRRELREQTYRAYVGRASDCGPNPGQWDNSGVIRQVISLRQESAALLGYADYAGYALVNRMANSVSEVESFLTDLSARARPFAERELQTLEQFAEREFGSGPLARWDLPYYSEKLRAAICGFDPEAVRPFFPLPRVLEGLFEVVNRLFGIMVRQTESPDLWHDDVTLYEILDASGNQRGKFFLDPYAREHKRGGAWMADCAGRRRMAGGAIQNPVAFLTCNFTPPVGDRPALLTHDEVLTLFHEFGHGLHHMLTTVEESAVAGISGVPWDAVELPSQILENWCWEPEVLDMLARHVDTHERLPADLVKRLRSARTFQSGLQMVRQLEFALFDLRLHATTHLDGDDAVQNLLDQVRHEVSVLDTLPFDRFQNSFSHIFAGGYAAGYYSYLWAEVLSADAYSRFEEEGIFDPQAGQAFLQEVLEKGGVENPLDMFVAFRGRDPGIESFLRHQGLIE